MPFRRRGQRPEREPPSPPAPSLPSGWRDWERVPPDRLELAGQIESCPDFAVEPEGPGCHRISLYDDLRALVGDDAIEALAGKIGRLDGVARCNHDDREEMVVEGAVTGEQLAAFVIAELAATGDPSFWDDPSP